MRDVIAVRFVGDGRRGVGITFEWDTKVGTAVRSSGVSLPRSCRGHRRAVCHLLSASGMELAPVEVALRAVELDLIGRSGLTYSIVRPA